MVEILLNEYSVFNFEEFFLILLKVEKPASNLLTSIVTEDVVPISGSQENSWVQDEFTPVGEFESLDRWSSEQ